MAMFIECFSLVTCYVCVPLYISAYVGVGVLAQVLSGKGEIRGGDGVRNGQLQHLLLHSSSHFNLGVSASPSRRNVECVGEKDLQLTLVVRKRMLAFTRCLWITGWKCFSSTLLLSGHFFQGRQKNSRKLKAKDVLNEKYEIEAEHSWFNKEDSVLWLLGKPGCSSTAEFSVSRWIKLIIHWNKRKFL